MSDARTQSKPSKRPWGAINRLGPWFALFVAVGFTLWMPLPPERTREIDERHARIKSVFERVPLRMGEWVGEESPLTPSAVELLRPNAALSRSYRRLGLPANYKFSLIHCSDFRDMGGHYPPVCYPAHGWSLEHENRVGSGDLLAFDPEARAAEADESGAAAVSLAIGDGFGPAEMAIYRFSRAGRDLQSVRMTVVSAFILPDGRWSRSLGQIRDAAGRRRLAAEGVAQVQIAMAGWPGLDAIDEPIAALLGSIPTSVWNSLGLRERSTEADSNE